MYLFETEIRAIDPSDGELKTWGGPMVPGISFSDAEDYCQRNELGYCKVVGRFLGYATDNSIKEIEGAFSQWRIDQN